MPIVRDTVNNILVHIYNAFGFPPPSVAPLGSIFNPSPAQKALPPVVLEQSALQGYGIGVKLAGTKFVANADQVAAFSYLNTFMVVVDATKILEKNTPLRAELGAENVALSGALNVVQQAAAGAGAGASIAGIGAVVGAAVGTISALVDEVGKALSREEQERKLHNLFFGPLYNKDGARIPSLLELLGPPPASLFHLLSSNFQPFDDAKPSRVFAALIKAIQFIEQEGVRVSDYGLTSKSALKGLHERGKVRLVGDGRFRQAKGRGKWTWPAWYFHVSSLMGYARVPMTAKIPEAYKKIQDSKLGLQKMKWGEADTRQLLLAAGIDPLNTSQVIFEVGKDPFSSTSTVSTPTGDWVVRVPWNTSKAYNWLLA